MKESDKFSKIFDEFKELLDKKDFDEVNKLMLQYLFDKESTPGDLKTILVITKGFKTNEVIRENRQLVLHTLETRLGIKLV